MDDSRVNAAPMILAVPSRRRADAGRPRRSAGLLHVQFRFHASTHPPSDRLCRMVDRKRATAFVR
jgi:hypothetical protein